jgi:Thrombospondin C-terminal region
VQHFFRPSTCFVSPALGLLLGLLSAAPLAAQTPVDLGTWTAESYAAVSGFGAGIWTVAPGGSSVTQSINGQPTLFVSDFNVFNTQIEGQITPGGGDDDYIGFALGFLPGDSTSAAADYLLVDWKAGTQNFDFGAPACTPGSLAPRGLAVSRVRGIPTADEFWGHVNFDSVCSDLSNGLEELARGTTLGDTGWTANQTYTFKFVFDSTHLEVYVNGNLEMNVSGSFANGRMAFYNFSQAGVKYNAFTLNCPASWEHYGTGLAGFGGVPALLPAGQPILGTTLPIFIGNSSGLESICCLFVGTQPAALPTAWLGTLLVDDQWVIDYHPLPAAGTTLNFSIGNDLTFCGQDLYAQTVQVDFSAPAAIAFSQGLHLIIGQ